MFKLFLIGWRREVFALFSIYLIYLLAGAVLFVVLEKGNEILIRKRIMEDLELAKKMIDGLREKNTSDAEIFELFQREHVARRREGCVHNSTWRQFYGEKVFFSLILITTVGYGNVAPKSMWGKVFCIIYTFFGLPLNVVMMRLLSLKLRRGLRRTLKVVQQRYSLKIWLLWLSGMLFYSVFVIVFFLVPAGIFTYTEMWTYAQGLYFSFVSLATIGLGDYVADLSSSRSEQTFYPVYVILMLIWLVFGIAFLSMTGNLVSYMLGSNLLDKLDCKCKVRSSAKSALGPVISNVAELNWQLAKYTPLGFRNSRDVQEFEELCLSNPQNVTPHSLKSMLDLIYDLREVCYDQLEILDLDESDAIESKIEIVTDTEGLRAEDKKPENKFPEETRERQA